MILIITSNYLLNICYILEFHEKHHMKPYNSLSPSETEWMWSVNLKISNIYIYIYIYIK